ncbi:unnamed protein product [Microthlaspi erraticum]|uniref:Uncharacterized protein n=1 Tax=Microthlaspi erraticum TaxID=1685480 RepID=A0A6D2JJW6_9BRAS|nr:unnamed protein product [Microthlaspi erraticum]
MCISTQIVDCQLNLVLNQKSDRLEIPLQSLTPLICRLWANSALKPSAAPLPLEVLPEPLVEPLAENEPITASANPPLSHQDPEPEHHPNPEQPPLPNQPRIHTGLTRHGYRLGHRRNRHTRHHTLSRIRRSPQSRPRPPRPQAPRPLAPQPLATQSISLMEPKRAH